MRNSLRICLVVFFALLSACSSEMPSDSGNVGSARNASSVGSIYDVLTRNYNNQRTGANTDEFWLNTGTVNPKQFGKLFEVSVDDQVYAQVLVRWNLLVGGVTHDVFFVATVNNTVYAFDLDSGQLLWQRNFNRSGRPTSHTEVGQSCSPYVDFSGNIGIVGTPVIDYDSSTMYFVTRTVEGSATIQRLNAIDITTGNDRPQTPVQIVGSYGGVNFDPQLQNQRPGLAMVGSNIYVAWSSYCDTGPYHGWVMAFDATTLTPRATFATTPTGAEAGIWQGGGGITADNDNNIYVTTGNGTIGWAGSFYNYGFGLLKLSPTTLTPLDAYTINLGGDLDFGSSGPVFLPDSDILTSGAKDGRVYVFNRNGLNSMSLQPFQAVQNPASRSTHHIHGSNVSWAGPDGTNLYVWGENDYPRQYRWDTGIGQFDQPAAATASILPPEGMPGGMMTLSSNGSWRGSGILWATVPLSGDANHSVRPGVFRAFDAEKMSVLWESTGNPSDDSHNFAKFNPPVVTLGKVIVPSFSNVVSVYGVKQSTPLTSGLIVDLRKRNSTLPPVCFDVPYATTQPTQLQVVSCNASIAQDWQFNDVGGVWEIRRPGVDMCMDIPAAQVYEGQIVQQYPCNQSAAQQFVAVSKPEGITIRPAVNTGYCVTLPNDSTVPGTLLVLSACNDDDYVGSDAQTFTPIPSQLHKQNSGTPGMCVDVPFGSFSSGVRLQTYNCNEQENQSWQIMWWADGTNGIQRNSSGLCFDVPSGNAFSGQIVQQYACNGGSSQKWLVESRSNGFQIRFANTSFCVDVTNNSNNPNAQLQLYSCNGTDAQIWGRFQPQMRKTSSGTDLGMCIEATNPLKLDYCNGSSAQNLQILSNGAIQTSSNGCISASSPFTAGQQLHPGASCSPSSSTQWVSEPLASGGNQIRLVNTSMCIDMPWGYNSPGNLQIYPCNGGTSQLFAQ